MIRREADGLIYTGKCQDTEHGTFYPTIYLPHQERCPLTFYTIEEQANKRIVRAE